MLELAEIGSTYIIKEYKEWYHNLYVLLGIGCVGKVYNNISESKSFVHPYDFVFSFLFVFFSCWKGKFNLIFFLHITTYTFTYLHTNFYGALSIWYFVQNLKCIREIKNLLPKLIYIHQLNQTIKRKERRTICGDLGVA